MLNSLKIKLHKATMALRKNKTPAFVNPYAPVEKPMSKINPYITEYGTKKKKSVEELIMERVKQKKDGVIIPPSPTAVDIIPVGVQEPSFVHDMKELFVGDVLTVASKFPKRIKKEKTMSAEEIKRACEGVVWK